MGSIFLYIYAFSWFYIFWSTLKKYNYVWVTSVVTYFLYFVISVIAIVYFQNVNAPVRLLPLIYLIVMLLIGASPVSQYDSLKYERISFPSHKLYQYFIYFYIILAIIRIPSMLSIMREGFTTLLVSSTGGHDLYMEAHANHEMSDRLVSNLIAIIYNLLSDLGIFLFFSYLAYPNRKRILLIGLSLSMIIRTIAPIASGQRTGITMSFLTMIVSYFMFKQYYEERIKRVIRVIGITVLGFIIALFVFFSMTRFGEDAYIDSMVTYAGQAPVNFSSYCFEAGGVRYGDRTCPEFKRLIGFQDVPQDIDLRRAKYSHLKIDDYWFYTYVGDFVLDFGPVIAFVLFVLFSSLFKKMTIHKGSDIPYHKLVLIFFAMCVCVQGGMYLFTYAHMDNYKILMTIVVYLVFLFDYKTFKKNGC